MDTTNKRSLTVQEHDNFRRKLYSTPTVDEIDEAVADIPNPPAMRKESEVSRVLSILDSFERGNG